MAAIGESIQFGGLGVKFNHYVVSLLAHGEFWTFKHIHIQKMHIYFIHIYFNPFIGLFYLLYGSEKKKLLMDFQCKESYKQKNKTKQKCTEI